ncbi:TetR/AcrR family transcriptional regulator [Spirochaeta cellobiosiphila]|uniref:TetR/AcrR family transcriptional regulator n=1 Tax=Spirochaeta cellobiosiphila TaxID=504483 RepID=UPI00056D63AA|nr:TetR/AcrR family transcriptional regulator [Spirochaeta cellobiosiphila]
MPKIIKNISERLEEELEKMVCDEGKEISIRALAARVGVAVGTIYNYYPTKDEMIKVVFQREWSNTIKIIQEGLNNTKSPEGSDLKLIVTEIYNLIEKVGQRHAQRKKSIDCKHTVSNPPYPHSPQAWEWLVTSFIPVWQGVLKGKGIEDQLNRLTISTISSISRLLFQFPDQRDENINFVLDQIVNGGLYAVSKQQ